MNIFRKRGADWITYEEEEVQKIPQGVIELGTSGKMTKTRVNSITVAIQNKGEWFTMD